MTELQDRWAGMVDGCDNTVGKEVYCFTHAELEMLNGS